MNNHFANKYARLLVRQALTFSLLALFPFGLGAFTLDTYAPNSALASGTWVKIKVPESGMYMVTTSQLRQWGFSSPERVRVFGYGGRPSDNIMSLDRYTDDLPMTLCESTSQGLVFYAAGPVAWKCDNNGFWSHQPNYYSTEAYYFLGEATDEQLAATATPTGTPEADADAATTFVQALVHENELISPGSTGHTLLGEDFRFTQSQSFQFTLPDRADDSVRLLCNFAIKAPNGASTLTFSINGTQLPPTSKMTMPMTSDDGELHYVMNSVPAEAVASGDRLTVGLSFATLSSPIRLARLDNLIVNYQRRLALTGSQLEFSLSDRSAILSGVSADTRVWDVTNAADVRPVNVGRRADGTAVWTATEPGNRRYVAWNPGAALPVPSLAATVASQDIHGRETPDMVIITLPQWTAQAEQLAEIHRTSGSAPLDVMVVTQEEVFNEFSSGTPDINAFRRMMKMFYDRGGGSAASPDSKVKYLLMFGRALYDHRGLTSESQQIRNNILLQWQSLTGGSAAVSFTSEDYLAFLQDDSGKTPASDYHCVGVGRIPVSSEAECRTAVEKIRAYMADNNRSDWKNRIILVADDGNSGIHMEQMERVYNRFMSTPRGQQHLYHKVYIDAFPLVNNVAVDARERMYRLLNQGAGWWWYIGHANTNSWTSQGLLTLQDINNAGFQHQPMLYAATCEFLRWDAAAESGAETLFFNPSGIIGAIAATRPVYISGNENMSKAVASAAVNVEPGEVITSGDIMRRAKNTLLMPADDNKLRYVLLGDPAMPLASTAYSAVIDSFDGVPVDPENPPVLKARQVVKLSGRIVDAQGNDNPDFNGAIIPTLYDAEYSTTSEGRDIDDTEGKEVTFEEMGDRLFAGRDQVTDGAFDVTIYMPTEITYNYRPATLSLYATSDDGADASGVSRSLYVYGYDETADDDLIPPVIEMFVLNSDEFRPGGKVNESPVVIARVRDDVAINLSAAGVGHQMSLQLDGHLTFNDLSNYYTPGDDGAKSGTIVYSLSELAAGDHTLRLRVWDTSNNLTEETIDFRVTPGQAPSIFDLYCDANPAVDHANFYVRHNRPDAMLDVNISVYDLMGRIVWSGSQTGRSDLFVSSPVTWNLTDMAGRRVTRGIYIYRATVSADGEKHASAARKIAVTAP